MNAPDRTLAQRRRAAEHDDITQPPTWTSSRPRRPGQSRRHGAENSASLNAIVALSITLLMVVWTLARGVPPSLDPQAGIPLLVMQIGAWLIGWMTWTSSDLADALAAQDSDASPVSHTPHRIAATVAILVNVGLIVAGVVA